MSVNSVHSNQASVDNLAVSQAQSAEKQASQNDAIPVDRVTISAAAQAKQTAASIGANSDQNGK